MASYNKVILVGNLTRDPQLSYLPSQTAVVEIGLAVNRRWRSQDGQQREETCFIDCRAYGRQAETINQYVKKGQSILIEGRLQLDTWEGKDGVKRSKHRVFIETFQFMGGPSSGQGGGPARPAPARAPQQAAAPAHDEYPEPMPPEPYEEARGDDIPF